MRSVWFFSIVFGLLVGVVNGQDCVPNDTIPDSLLGVFPMPFDANESPEGGIRDTACVGFEYNFVFTAVVGDSFTLGETTLPLDSLWLNKETAVSGLPAGLDYACNPPTCVFKKNTKGCVILYGKPAVGTEGQHQMKLSGKLYADGNSFGLPLTFPDPNIAPGEYVIVVANKNESPCAQLSLNNLINNNIAIYPNPAQTELLLECDEAAQLKMVNYMGQIVLSQQIFNEKSNINISSFSKGVYRIIIENDNGLLRQEAIIIK